MLLIVLFGFVICCVAFAIVTILSFIALSGTVLWVKFFLSKLFK